MSQFPDGFPLDDTRERCNNASLDRSLTEEELDRYERWAAATHSWPAVRLCREVRRARGLPPACICLQGVGECAAHQNGIQMCGCHRPGQAWCYQHGDITTERRASGQERHQAILKGIEDYQSKYREIRPV